MRVVADVPSDNIPYDGGTDSGMAGWSGRALRTPDRRRRRWWLVCLLAAIVATAAVAVAGHPRATTRSPGAALVPPMKVFATLPYWNLAGGSQTVVTYKADFEGASPWMYGVVPDGQVVSLVAPNSVQVLSGVGRLQSAGLPLMPTISNTRDGAWDYKTIASILHDVGLRARHVRAIVDLVQQRNFAGIDIDYENLHADDRSSFSQFVAELARALHAHHKLLSVDVFAKVTDAGYDQRNVAQDYAALGRAADQVRLMGYDWHWSTSGPGAIAPLDWVGSVLRYAVTQIPADKIVLGVPLYGYDWVGNQGQLVSWLQAYGIAKKYHAVVHWDAKAQSPWLTYQTADGAQHVVWFENSYSTSAKLALAREFGLYGVYLWLAGDEDSLTWTQLAHEASGPVSASPSSQSSGAH